MVFNWKMMGCSLWVKHESLHRVQEFSSDRLMDRGFVLFSSMMFQFVMAINFICRSLSKLRVMKEKVRSEALHMFLSTNE